MRWVVVIIMTYTDKIDLKKNTQIFRKKKLAWFAYFLTNLRSNTFLCRFGLIFFQLQKSHIFSIMLSVMCTQPDVSLLLLSSLLNVKLLRINLNKEIYSVDTAIRVAVKKGSLNQDFFPLHNHEISSLEIYKYHLNAFWLQLVN